MPGLNIYNNSGYLEFVSSYRNKTTIPKPYKASLSGLALVVSSDTQNPTSLINIIIQGGTLSLI